MYPRLYKNIYFAAQFLRGEHVRRAMEELERSQWLSPPEMEELQWGRLQSLLEHAYSWSPHYRRKWDKAGFRPRGSMEASDFRNLPLLTREQVMKEADEILIRNSGRLTVYNSSGTTGAPLTLYLSREALGYHHAAQWRGFRWYGLGPGQSHAKVWGVPLLPSQRFYERAKDLFLNRLRLSAFRLSEEEMRRFHRSCRRRRPAYLYGYASSLARLANYIKTIHEEPPGWRPRAVITTSEILYDWQRKTIQDAFRCPVVDEYGTSEVGIIAFQCPQGGLHITSENIYLEILKPDSDEPVLPGEPGRVVVTSLRNRAFPLIRYDLGDYAAVSDELCQCGRGLPLIKSIQGRSNDAMLAGDGSVVHSELLAYINRVLQGRGMGMEEYVVIQKSRERLVLLVTRDTTLSPEAEEYLGRQIRLYLGDKVSLEVERVHELPQDRSGKMRYFISDVS
jgi:phenylacetate-CoA ligase